MARIISTIVIAGAAVLFFAQSAFAFRCDGGVISRGEFIDIVIAKCGEPTSSRVIKEEVTGSFGHTAANEGPGRVIRGGTVTKTVEQTEVLMYNCGGYHDCCYYSCHVSSPFQPQRVLGLKRREGVAPVNTK